jgi:hypothetical protein
MQLEFPVAPPPAEPPWWHKTVRLARHAVDVHRIPGYTVFTNGLIQVGYHDEHRLDMNPDTPWTANAIRTALLDTGLAVDGDPTNETTTVVVWKIHHAQAATVPDLEADDQTADPHRPGFFLRGPDGSVEQQCGAAGHNELIAHAGHPFPGSSRGACEQHGDMCWRRWAWPHAERVRHLLTSARTETGSAYWALSNQAAQRMRHLYGTYIHATRPE